MSVKRGAPNPLARELAEKWDDVGPVLEELLAVAREGVARSNWKPGDRDHALLLPIIGALTVFFGQRLRVTEMPPTEAMLREQIGRELREVAARHPAGSARRAAFLEAAAVAETEQR